MTRKSRLSDEDWASALCAYEERIFKKRVSRCRDENRLRLAVQREGTRMGGPRQERVAYLNQRIAEVSDDE